jgi:transposase-like protein
MATSTRFGVIVEVVCHGTERTALRGPTGPAHPGRTDTAHTEFVICDESIEQDHRSVKRLTRPLLGFKSFDAARCTLAGIELMHMLRKGQLVGEEGAEGLTPAEQFYALAA